MEDKRKESKRVLRYYYARREQEFSKRWLDIVKLVIDLNSQGITENDIVKALLNSKYRVLLEDKRTAKRKGE